MEQSDLASNDATVDTMFGDMKGKEVRLHEGASSDGYLAHIFRHMAKELFNEDGCLSGRGQAQVEDWHTDRALLWQMEGIYAAIPVWPLENSAHVQELYQKWLGWGGGGDSP
ncbi:hypothetical protein QTO34_000419 [Cnephaeus nilssonii]|uniref:Uncharacterized protein n=1 Tax=Cnephaeus nilssonii TaxID=3371016 RepID=A0AA40LWX6_CNENI|nr:hypothetical protein QTO34_000419 [Eptesicus nilssonii]